MAHRCIRKLVLLALWLTVSASVTASDTLVYAKFNSVSDEEDFYSPLNEIVETLFKESEFTVKPKTVPVGVRVLSELHRGAVDIVIMTIGDPILADFERDVPVDIHPVPIASFPRHFYSLKSHQLTVAAAGNLSDYRLGFMNMPEESAKKMLGNKEVGSLSFFTSHLKLSKGLAAGRTDIIVIGRHVANATFETLGINEQVVDLGEAYPAHIRLLIRNSMPEEKRRAVYDLMTTRIPVLKQQGVFAEIMAKKGWQ